MNEEEKPTNPTEEIQPADIEPREPEVTENSDRPTVPDIDAIVERAVKSAVERIGQQIAAAEERGYQRAVSEARERAVAARLNEPTRCNFLTPTRPDIWE